MEHPEIWLGRVKNYKVLNIKPRISQFFANISGSHKAQINRQSKSKDKTRNDFKASGKTAIVNYLNQKQNAIDIPYRPTSGVRIVEHETEVDNRLVSI